MGDKKGENEVVVKKEVEGKLEGEKSEEIGDEEVRGDTIDKFIYKNSPLKRTKKQILNEPNPELLDYITPSYPILKMKPKLEMKVDQFKKFMDILTKIQVNIPFVEALEYMLVYVKFMKELLSGNHKLMYDENITLA